MKPRDRLRIAVQKSGRLGDPSQDLLARCGLKFRQSRDKLFCFGESLAIDLLLVRDDDIPGLIADGVCDLGIVGRNVLAEQQAAVAARGETPAVDELRPLGFGRCRLSIAVPQELDYAGPSSLAGLRVATTYPALTAAWFAANGVDAKVVLLKGSVEIAPKLGTADAICDLVSTGSTLVANQLREAAAILDSEAVLAGAGVAPNDERGELLELLLRRIDGVIQVRESKLVMLHAPRASIAGIARLLPPGQRPTITPIEGSPDEVALQAVCHGAITWQHLEDMKRAGASGMLVLPVEKMLA
ncbi:ATP phosphoribosyltransferase [Tahibacter soli]|jgi:ATP phosphoribosyltransferase|uniref:ATP phosphoribosyltransferase n=1 Tax=Tahibacter soli TaxID=2983605 RepID=A0A9X3YLK4_9GAMM|nr:ATP phosphoribosyltransferase [Tahibacter soli]MDC8012953.1 ATP phosphoribosyltransferase [Tahibacter soli]